MSRIFADDGGRIVVKNLDDGIQLCLYEVADIFPALHYFESHPEARSVKIVVTQSLLRTAEMKNEYGRGDFSYSFRS